MSRRGGGIGMIVLLVAMAIVCLLALKSWLAVAPTAMDAVEAARGGARSNGTAKTSTRPAGTGESAPLRDLPGLGEMKERTDRHAQEVDEARRQTDQP